MHGRLGPLPLQVPCFLLTFKEKISIILGLLRLSIFYNDLNRFGKVEPLSKEVSLVEPGVLYVVSTPIGNLADISLRALQVLQQVDLVAAEDTRTSRVLLSHHNINTPLYSYHDFNEAKAAPILLAKLQSRQSVALITDAGTPGISDPAYYMIRMALEANIPVQAVPGATALIPALVISGIPCERFVFEGFLPAKKGRQTRLLLLQNEPRTIVLYESPHRLLKTLDELHTVLGDRRVAIVRELTKKFEQVLRGTLSEFTEQPSQVILKGEFVLVVEGLNRRVAKTGQDEKNEYEN
jgi:16S rRNA (cytidine1402-2'-O)-methyltransferase